MATRSLIKYAAARCRGWQRPALALLLLLILGGCDKSKPLAIWLRTGVGPGEVIYPRALSYDPTDDTFYCIDHMARLQHLDHNGQFIDGWAMPESKLGKPEGVIRGPDGNLYIADTDYHRLLVYSHDGKLLHIWGKQGNGVGEFQYPTAIAFDSKGRMFVAENGSSDDRIQVFDLHFKKLFEFSHYGQNPGQLARPQSMVFDSDDILYVADACNHRVSVFTSEGKFVRCMGSCGSALGQFRFPYGIALDHQGHLIVCEFGNNRVQMIDKQTGKGLAIWGRAGREPGELAYPWDVAVDKRDRVVAVDAGNNRLQVFDF